MKTFKWIKCKRKNGTEFLKLLYYNTLSNGYVEAGRFNMANAEKRDGEWNIEDILKELES